MQRRVPFSPPRLGEEGIAEAVDRLHSDWITTGPKTRLFEEKSRDCVSAPAALALPPHSGLEDDDVRAVVRSSSLPQRALRALVAQPHE